MQLIELKCSKNSIYIKMLYTKLDYKNVIIFTDLVDEGYFDKQEKNKFGEFNP